MHLVCLKEVAEQLSNLLWCKIKVICKLLEPPFVFLVYKLLCFFLQFDIIHQYDPHTIPGVFFLAQVGSC